MAINLATKYSNKVDERFEKQSQASLVTSGEYEFNGVDTVKVYSIDTVAMNDYSRTGSNRYGTAGELGDTVQTLQVTKDGGKVEAITGATITSKAVCSAVRAAIAAVESLG